MGTKGIAGLGIGVFDDIALVNNVKNNPTTVTYSAGGKVIAVVTIGYDADDETILSVDVNRTG